MQVATYGGVAETRSALAAGDGNTAFEEVDRPGRLDWRGDGGEVRHLLTGDDHLGRTRDVGAGHRRVHLEAEWLLDSGRGAGVGAHRARRVDHRCGCAASRPRGRIAGGRHHAPVRPGQPHAAVCATCVGPRPDSANLKSPRTLYPGRHGYISGRSAGGRSQSVVNRALPSPCDTRSAAGFTPPSAPPPCPPPAGSGSAIRPSPRSGRPRRRRCRRRWPPASSPGRRRWRPCPPPAG